VTSLVSMTAWKTILPERVRHGLGVAPRTGTARQSECSFASRGGATADDREHSPFTQALLTHLETAHARCISCIASVAARAPPSIDPVTPPPSVNADESQRPGMAVRGPGGNVPGALMSGAKP
jgi:hypothetical protein